MKQGDKVRLEIRKSESLEKLEKEKVAGVEWTFKTDEIAELEGKILIFERSSPGNNNHVIVKTPDGQEHEVNKQLLKKIE